MLVTVTYEPERDSGVDATMLGYLLHKHPAKVQTFSAPVGEIQVFYPEATAERCTSLVSPERVLGSLVLTDEPDLDDPVVDDAEDIDSRLQKLLRLTMCREGHGHHDEVP